MKPGKTLACLALTLAALRAQDPVPATKPVEEVKKDAPAPADKFTKSGGPDVVFAMPKGWKAKESSSTMRLADVEIPGKEVTTCVVYWFGKNGAGSVDANIDRWAGQLETDQKPTRTNPPVAEGFKAHVVELAGRYVAPVNPGSPETVDHPDWRLLGAILETPGGPLYLKLVGPTAAVEAARADFLAWLKSFRGVAAAK